MADRVVDEEIATDTRSIPALVCNLRAGLMLAPGVWPVLASRSVAVRTGRHEREERMWT